MADKTPARSVRVITPRQLLAPSAGAIVIALISLFGSMERASRQAVGMAWLFIGLVGFSAYYVTSALQKRIASLEEDVAALRRDSGK